MAVNGQLQTSIALPPSERFPLFPSVEEVRSARCVSELWPSVQGIEPTLYRRIARSVVSN